MVQEAKVNVGQEYGKGLDKVVAHPKRSRQDGSASKKVLTG
jgi:hypothetical protein